MRQGQLQRHIQLFGLFISLLGNWPSATLNNVNRLFCKRAFRLRKTTNRGTCIFAHVKTCSDSGNVAPPNICGD